MSQQNESVLIQKIFTHFKKAPGTHKLGVLYVVDSVTRQWVEAARKAGQPPGNEAPDGTFAAGVNRVTELLPVLMTDIINNAPQDQKVRTRHAHIARGLGPIASPSTIDLSVSALGESYNLRIASYRIGKDQETDRHLGAWLHLPCSHAHLVP